MRYKTCFRKRSKRLQRNAKNIFCCFKKLFSSHTVPLLRQKYAALVLECWKFTTSIRATNMWQINTLVHVNEYWLCQSSALLAQSGGPSPRMLDHVAPVVELGPGQRLETRGLHSWRCPVVTLLPFIWVCIFLVSKISRTYVSGAFDSICWIDPED